MNAGKFRQRLIVQTKVEIKGSMNATLEDWDSVPTLTLPAELMSTTSREYADALKRNSEMTHLFRLRYHPTLADPKAQDFNRILFTMTPDISPVKYQTLNIFPPRFDNSRREMFIECKETK